MYERQGREHSRGYSPPGVRHESVPRAPTPAERAHEAVLGVEHGVASADFALKTLDAARETNNPERWNEARSVLDERLREAFRALERAKLFTPDSAEVAARLEISTRALEDVEREASLRREAPSGLTPVAHEAEILELLARPIEGSIAAGYVEKEAALLGLLARLDVKDSRTLIARLQRARANDPLVSRFERMQRSRQDRILRFLENARRREWMLRERELRRPPAATHIPAEMGPSPPPEHEASPVSEPPPPPGLDDRHLVAGWNEGGDSNGTTSGGSAKQDETAPGKTAPVASKGAGGGTAEPRDGNVDSETDAMDRAVNESVARHLAWWDEAAQKLTLDEVAAKIAKKKWHGPTKSGFFIRILGFELVGEGPAATGLRAYTILATFRIAGAMRKVAKIGSSRIATEIVPDDKPPYRFEERRYQFFFDPATQEPLSEKPNAEYLAQLRALAAKVDDDGTKLAGKTIATSRWTMEIRKAERRLMRLGTTKIATAQVVFRNVKLQGDRMRNSTGELFVIANDVRQELLLPLLE